MTKALVKVFGRPAYLLLAFFLAFTVLMWTLWIPNLALIDIVVSSAVSLGEKVEFLFSFLGSLFTNHSLWSAGLTLGISILFGINISILVYYIKSLGGIRSGLKVMGKSSIGLFAGLVGVGCASCGALLLAPILGAAVVTGIATALPLAGAEFGILGVILLLWSTSTLLKRIA